MPRRPSPLIVAGIALATALTAALGLESVYRISITPRSEVTRPAIARTSSVTDTSSTHSIPSPPSTPSTSSTSSTSSIQSIPPAASTQSVQTPLPLRLVDSGGVGIPLTGRWGGDYSHDARIFHEVLLDKAPYVDRAAFQRIEQDWHAYVERMLAYGNNAIAVPMLLELIDFDRVKTTDGSSVSVYDGEADETFRARHAAVRRAFGPLFEWTARRGMQVFLTTDMLTVTPPLARHLRRVAPAASVLGIDAADPAVWQVYRAGLDELFDTMPSISGLVVRFGEGGNLYNTAGWPYRSEVAIRDAKSLRAMLHGLLPIFEQRQRTLVLRSWTVGVGSIGRLHIDPATYEKVLGDIDSPALVVSTKYTAGDFFSYLPLNPTLMTGRHRRLVELQARPEFEGFGAFPDFLGEEYARALRTIRAANPRLAGTYIYSQSGGPLRAGPRMLYPLHGFWLWTDANVFVASRLAIDSSSDVRALAKQWGSERLGDGRSDQGDEVIGDAIATMLIETRRAVREGFYIRAFAEREVRVPGLELPPLMWIFEWDRVGGWHSLLSLVYRGARDDVDASIAEGHEAAAIVRRQRELVRATFATADVAGPASEGALKSLEYQESLFDALAAWRTTFLSYYRWLDTGDSHAWSQWRASRGQFQSAADRHVARFGHDLEFPAFDLRSAYEAEANASRAAWGRRLAVALLIVLVSLIALGSPFAQRRLSLTNRGAFTKIARLTFIAAATPWRLVREPIDIESSAAVSLLAISLVAMLAATLTSFTTATLVINSPLLVAVVALAFESTALGHAGRQPQGEDHGHGQAHGHGRLLVASVGPLLPGIILLFVLIAWASPLGFWYRFWISPIFRAVVVTTGLAMAMWTGYMMLASHAIDGWRGRLGGILAAAGAGCITLSALMPGWLDVLRSLDRPLNVAPATETMLFALRTYVGVSLGVGNAPYVIGGLMLAAGYALSLRSVLARVSGRGRGGIRAHPRSS